MVTREQLTFERVKSLISMLADDGSATPGNISGDHVRALEQAGDKETMQTIAERHRNGNPPP